jgi:hypothetical protein
MKTKFLSTTLAAALFGALTLGSMQASAATFSFSQHSGFDVSNTWLISTDATTPNNDIVWYEHSSGQTPVAGTFDTIAWSYPSLNADLGNVAFDPFLTGTNSNTHYSGLRVSGWDGSVSTGANFLEYGGWEKISTVYHKNSPINSLAATLASALIYSELNIGSYVDPHAIPITFVETFNYATLGQCLSGAPNGSLCDDLFRFPSGGLDDVFFSAGGLNYQVQFKLDNFNNSVTNYPCPGPMCTVWTAEGVISDLSIFMRIREIPEPSSLALMGLALLGFGLRGRKAT